MKKKVKIVKMWGIFVGKAKKGDLIGACYTKPLMRKKEYTVQVIDITNVPD